jgi:hypothetical protein
MAFKDDWSIEGGREDVPTVQNLAVWQVDRGNASVCKRHWNTTGFTGISRHTWPDPRFLSQVLWKVSDRSFVSWILVAVVAELQLHTPLQSLRY